MMPAISVGIIAAGEGSRFMSRDPLTIKPMVPVAGKPLVYWTVSHLQAAGVQAITYLRNNSGIPAKKFLLAEFPKIKWTFMERNTPASWESFRILAAELAKTARQTMITTVDAIISPDDITKFMAAPLVGDAALALTEFVDDEKPLWAHCNPDGRVTAVGEKVIQRKFATSGLYRLSSPFAGELRALPAYKRLRDFWSWAAENRRITGIPLSKTVDVDRPEDIPVAEEFLQSLEAHAARS